MSPALRKQILECVPDNWLDSLLTGPSQCIGDPPWWCHDIERLLRGIRARLVETLEDGSGVSQ